MIEYHNPEASVGVDAQPYELSLPLRGEDSVRIGLLANGFPDSEQFLEQVGIAIREQVPGVEIFSWNKGNASIPATDAMLAEISKQCAGVVAAYGH